MYSKERITSYLAGGEFVARVACPKEGGGWRGKETAPPSTSSPFFLLSILIPSSSSSPNSSLFNHAVCSSLRGRIKTLGKREREGSGCAPLLCEVANQKSEQKGNREMGNCQAADASTVVIQHPKGGRVERLYWPVSASEVMRNNPGHYVALVTFCHTTAGAGEDDRTREGNEGGVRLTRVKLLRPKDVLILGQVYRLVTAQEVMKGLWSKKCEKERLRKNQLDSSSKRHERPREARNPASVRDSRPPAPEIVNQGVKQERHRPKPSQSAVRSSTKPWRPSLQSISEEEDESKLLLFASTVH
ncbi:hypothetical protein H6P81_011086 [Aristolochia fimbriata]|uniref:Uncharacterized protein n=1 Tax=Aristolochia fimbriata TaxID=158543 RepID=A0AAV7ETE3_ARIFI|nr:hypothetical protein H6P81_011086 [Aristolochia fimbriata]